MECRNIARGNACQLRLLAGMGVVAVLIALSAQGVLAQTEAMTPKKAIKLDVAEGTKASYRAREQLAGVNFMNDAIGSTQTVSGTLVLMPDGSVDGSQSKLTVDLRTLQSDQDMRDGYIKSRTLQTDKFPYAEFVPRKLTGVPAPLPSPERATDQSGFQLSGDLTIHGVTKPVTFNGYATFSRDSISGLAQTDFTFMDFGLDKPKLARLLSVDDKIQIELSFKLKRS